MPSPSRSIGRDIYVYDEKDPNTVMGGLVLTSGITNANLYSMVEIICFFDSIFFLRDEYGTTIQRDDSSLYPGKYYILTSGMFSHSYIYG